MAVLFNQATAQKAADVASELEAGARVGLESGARVGLESGAVIGNKTIAASVLRTLSAGPMSRLQIARDLGHSRVSGAINRAIKELMKQGLIEYTMPNKPSSRLQRYRLTNREA